MAKPVQLLAKCLTAILETPWEKVNFNVVKQGSATLPAYDFTIKYPKSMDFRESETPLISLHYIQCQTNKLLLPFKPNLTLT